MELYMQMGHGMKNIAKDYLNENHGGMVIISPMNIAPSSVIKYAGEVHRLDGNILFDPQIYFPRKFHKNLVKYEYYPKENITAKENAAYMLDRSYKLFKDKYAEAYGEEL